MLYVPSKKTEGKSTDREILDKAVEVLTREKDEYKWRVNRPYEAFQIIKNGDCYDTPYYGRLVEVVDEDGKHVGYMEVWLKRSPETVNLNLLKSQIVLKNKE